MKQARLIIIPALFAFAVNSHAVVRDATDPFVVKGSFLCDETAPDTCDLELDESLFQNAETQCPSSTVPEYIQTVEAKKCNPNYGPYGYSLCTIFAVFRCI